ncbi:hypothetical protein FACS1894192_03520 [Bacilli bacterium]|nr:hypothetical protein FACS1894192_03520 [Bacilli bacterium]
MENIETFFLDKKYKHILMIIEQVSKEPSKSITLRTLESRLAITQKTILTYLDELLQYCKQNNLETFTLQKSNLEMSSDTTFNIFDLYHYFMENSVKFQIIMTVFKNQQIDFTTLHHDLALSKSSASKYIKQINSFLKQYHCKINFLKKNSLQGEEHQIRFLYYNLLWGLDLDKIIEDSLKLQQVMALFSKTAPQIPYINLSKIKLSFYIFQVASKSGRFIASKKDFILPDSPYISYKDFFDKINALDFLSYCPDLQTKQKEGRYLYFLFCRASILTINECRQYDNQISLSNSPSVQYFISEFQEKSGLILKPSEIKFLSYNISLLNCEAAAFRGRAKNFDLDKLVTQYNKNGGLVPKLIKKFINHICLENSKIKKLIDNFPALEQYYTMLIRTIESEYHQPINILVQSSISTLHREALINQIRNSISFPITIYTSEQLHVEKPDGIISNWLPEKKYQDVPFFSISLFYTEWHKGELEIFLKKLKALKKDTRLQDVSF